jgi:pyruvate,water dikinase
MSETGFPAPGPGSWQLDSSHYTRPLTAFVAQAIAAGFRRGLAEGAARYGLLLEGFEPAIVHGFFYHQPVPLGARSGGGPTPPDWLLRLLVRLYPRARRRVATSRRAFEQRIWRDDLRRWDEELKPAAVGAHRALRAVQPAGLARADLERHLRECRAHMAEMMYQRHLLLATCGLPVGDFLASAAAWTGKSTGELLQLLCGSSPVSLGVAADELDALGAAVRADPDARRRVAAPGAAGDALQALRDAPGPVGAATAAYLDVVGTRSLGYDVCDPYAMEVPEALVRAIRAVAEGAARAEDPRVLEARTARVREAVPPEHRAAFDDLLAEARLVNRLRDERDVHGSMGAVGLARRAVLAVGARLVEDGSLGDPESAVDASCEELVALLRGEGGPGRAELERRAAWRRTRTVADAPGWLGAPPRPLPPPELLPEYGRRAARAMMVFQSALFDEAGGAPVARSVAGLPASAGVYEGTARRAMGCDDFGKIQQGDVLVTQATSPMFSVVLPLLGGVVTDRGGQLSHAAIVAREYGIPCVVGTGCATQVIEDGCRVRVDGDRGVVEVLS